MGCTSLRCNPHPSRGRQPGNHAHVALRLGQDATRTPHGDGNDHVGQRKDPLSDRCNPHPSRGRQRGVKVGNKYDPVRCNPHPSRGRQHVFQDKWNKDTGMMQPAPLTGTATSSVVSDVPPVSGCNPHPSRGRQHGTRYLESVLAEGGCNPHPSRGRQPGRHEERHYRSKRCNPHPSRGRQPASKTPS